jgi:hypothetical protein
MVLGRRRLVGLMIVLATSCSGPLDRVDGPRSTFSVPTTTSTTAVPLPVDVQDLMVATTMTESAQRIFAAANPAIEDAETFARSCSAGTEPGAPTDARTHTRGCYVGGTIHLRAPERAETRELMYVVAAHELLHAAYALLSAEERSPLDAELEAARAGNQRLAERLEPYGSTPTLHNEIHSILGSEFGGLSPALETYYAQYFSNRAAIVAARQRTLGDRENEIRNLKAQVDDLSARLAALADAQKQRRLAGDLESYNAAVEDHNELLSRYNTAAETLNTRIDEYNGLLGA